MPIIKFENYDDVAFDLIVEPIERAYTIAPSATVGIRYESANGVPHHFSWLGRHRIALYCDAPSYEIDIVEASPGEKFFAKVYRYGLLGRAGKRARDFLPPSGEIDAETLIEAITRAESDDGEEFLPLSTITQDWIRATFIEQMGAERTTIEALTASSRSPFDGAYVGQSIPL